MKPREAQPVEDEAGPGPGQQRLAFGKAPAAPPAEDEDMNGGEEVQSPKALEQASSPRAVGSTARPAYDAVRNSFDVPIGSNVPMEED